MQQSWQLKGEQDSNRKRRLDCTSQVARTARCGGLGCVQGQPESGRGCSVWLATLAHAQVGKGPRDPPGDRMCQASYQDGVKPVVMETALPLASALMGRTGSLTLAPLGLLYACSFPGFGALAPQEPPWPLGQEPVETTSRPLHSICCEPEDHWKASQTLCPRSSAV